MLRYCGPFLFLLSVPVFYYFVGASAPFATVALLLLALTGAELIYPRGDVPVLPENPRGFRLAVLLYIPLQLAITAWAVWISAHISVSGFAALALSLGVTTGVFGMLAAHEAVHSGDAQEAWLGVAMLTGMSYRHFRIAHIYGHHRWAGTDKDSATAWLGEGFYHFLGRTVRGQFLEAWAFEQKRRGWRGNRVLGDILVMALLAVAIGWVLGLRALLFFVCLSVVAVIVLELFNYIAHYGLVRGAGDDGRLESLDDRHSWNSSNVFANTLIFNMGRHSFHHRKPAAPYQSLRALEAPELPMGYAGSIVLALVPALWRRTMDAKARQWRLS